MHSAAYTTKRLLVTLPTGYIQITSGFHFVRHSEMMFLFDLHYSLGTNLTFHRSYFPVRLPVCHRHHLYVTKYKKDFRFKIHDHYKIFCSYNQIILAILWRTNDETFIVENSFTVMDKNVIVSLNNQNIKWYDKNVERINGFDSSLIYVMHFASIQFLKIFFLQTRKHIT